MTIRNIAPLALVALCAACSGYRVVKVAPNGGEVALQGNRDDAREKANAYMSQKCPNGFGVIEEGEAVIGSNTSGSAYSGSPRMTSLSSSSTDKTEWRVKYQCKGADGTVPPPPVSSAAPAPGAQNTVHELVVRF